MLLDENQINKSKLRRELFNNLFVNPKDNIDSDSVNCFLDLVDDLSLTKDLASGKIKRISLGICDDKALDRMDKVGSILNSHERNPIQLEYVCEYIESCCVELAKLYYEIGLNKFKNKVNNVVESLFEEVDIYDAVIGTSQSLDSIIEHHNNYTDSIKKTI